MNCLTNRNPLKRNATDSRSPHFRAACVLKVSKISIMAADLHASELPRLEVIENMEGTSCKHAIERLPILS
jgi:hypothetical protein